MVKKFFQHKVAKNTLALLLLQATNYIAPLIVLVYLANVLSVAIYGVVAFSVGIVQLSGVLTDFGFGLSASHKISTKRENKKFISRIIGAIFVIKLFLFAFVSIGICTFAILTNKYSEYSTLFLLSIIPMLGYSFQPTWFFIGVERMFYITVFSVIAKSLYIVFILFLVTSEGDYLWVPISNGVAQIVASVIGVVFIYRSGYYLSFPKRREIFYTLKMTRGVFLSRVSVAVYMRSAVLILGIFATPVAVAIYSLAEQMYVAMQSAFSSVVLAIYPHMAKEKDFPIFYKVVAGSIFVSILVSIFGYFLAPTLIPAILGDQWIKTIPVLNVFFIAIIIHVMAVMSGYPLAAALNRIDIANKSVVFGALVFLSLAVALIIFGGVSPVLLAVIMLASEFCVIVYRVLTLWTKVHSIKQSEQIGISCND